MALSDLFTALVLGLATPLTAVCVLPLYPGFISFLASKSDGNQKTWVFGLLITAGILTFMGALGLIFSILLGISLTSVIEVVSPILFAILAIISVFLLLDKDLSAFLPHIQAPQAKNPYLQSYLFGLFFGGIVLPCNPGFIAALFSTTLIAADPVTALGSFVMFGIGMGLPLIVLSMLSTVASRTVTSWLARHKTAINRVSGAILLGISIYYLFFVFKVHQVLL